MKNHWLFAVLALSACGAGVEGVGAEAVNDAESSTVSKDLNNGTGPCPGTWGAAPNYDGLSGTFQRASGWPAATGDLLSVTFVASSSNQGSVAGTYSSWVQGGYSYKTGGFSAMPDNPAIGATLTFGGVGYPGDGSTPKQIYFVAGLNRNRLGKVSSLCVGGTEYGTWFILNRIW